MKKLLSMMLIVFLAVLVILGVTTKDTLAHERRDVGKYQFVVGWIVEPALEGQKNGVGFRVTDNSSGTAVPVLGLEKTVKVEIIFVPTGVSKTFDLRTIFNDPGHYTSDLILTDAGVYKMRFLGDLQATALNETFNSRGGGGGYGDVESTTAIKFPTQVAEVREIEAVARHIEEENHELEEGVMKANTMAIAGIVLGALGTIAGVISLMASRQKAR